jgi:Fe-S cluster assembly scaffold protein SufB
MQVKVPMIMKQQKFVDAPLVDFVEKIVHEPEQKQIQVPVTQVPVPKKMHVPMIMKQQKCVDVQQVEFVDRVSEGPEHLQVLLEKEELKKRIAANYEQKGMELCDLLNGGKISAEEFAVFVRGSPASVELRWLALKLRVRSEGS